MILLQINKLWTTLSKNFIKTTDTLLLLLQQLPIVMSKWLGKIQKIIIEKMGENATSFKIFFLPLELESDVPQLVISCDEPS